jgi:hypothetical protein
MLLNLQLQQQNRLWGRAEFGDAACWDSAFEFERLNDAAAAAQQLNIRVGTCSFGN